jgi:hypothetical protein
MSENTMHDLLENTPLNMSEPLLVEPISVLPPNIPNIILASNRPGSASNPFGQSAPTKAEILAEREGSTKMAEKIAEVELKKASKAKEREGERGQWWPCDPQESNLKMLEEKGFLKEGSWRFVKGKIVPAPRPNERVMIKAWVEQGLSLPPSDFFWEMLETYGLQPHNIYPNSYIVMSNFASLFEGHLRIRPEIRLFQFYYKIKKEVKDRNMYNCRSVTFMLGPKRLFPVMSTHESARYWNAGLFYHKNMVAPGRTAGLPESINSAPQVKDSWTDVPDLTQHPDYGPENFQGNLIEALRQ